VSGDIAMLSGAKYLACRAKCSLRRDSLSSDSESRCGYRGSIVILSGAKYLVVRIECCSIDAEILRLRPQNDTRATVGEGEKRCGGDRGARTPNLGIANAALSQIELYPHAWYRV
jgi:hypothetical protein